MIIKEGKEMMMLMMKKRKRMIRWIEEKEGRLRVKVKGTDSNEINLDGTRRVIPQMAKFQE